MPAKVELILRAVQQVLSAHPEIIPEIRERLGLPYLADTDVHGNVCFVNATDVRPEFRECFTSRDVANYLFSLLPTAANLEDIRTSLSETFPYPENANMFWQGVTAGEKLHRQGTANQ